MEPTKEETVSAKPKITNRKLVFDAIRECQSQSGPSFADIKRFAISKKLTKVADFEKIKMYLTNAVDRGVLEKKNGKYKIKEAVGRKRTRSQRRKTNSAGLSRKKMRSAKKSVKKSSKKSAEPGKTTKKRLPTRTKKREH